MSEFKTAECIGVQGIVRVNVDCPYCGVANEMGYARLVHEYGDPFLGNQRGKGFRCYSCTKLFLLGPFRLEE